ncbi:MAG: hypothetical protein K0U93_22345, partial [Gammaproteobacteria bacterium]|nr:hypothetical protein [Gammaproteobacteria bacterium]
MIAIREEIGRIESGQSDANDNVLLNAPHTAEVLAQEAWPHSYSRRDAVFPAAARGAKYWPPVGRIDNVAGDRNLVCACPPLSDYVADAAD